MQVQEHGYTLCNVMRTRNKTKKQILKNFKNILTLLNTNF